MDRETATNLGADTVSGLLEGLGQMLRELMLNRKIYEVMAMWVMGLITAKVCADGIRSVLQSTDENSLRLQHAQRKELLGLLTENGENFMAACKRTFIDMKEDLWNKGSLLLRAFHHWHDREIDQSRARCAVAVTAANEKLSQSGWLSWLQFPVPGARTTLPVPAVSTASKEI